MKTPAAQRKVLVMLAGFLWSAVGIVLIAIAFGWEISFSGNLLIAIIVAVMTGAAIYRFGFSRLAAKNLSRIYAQAPGKEKVCVFAFQDKRSYFIVAVMMAMGYGLRHSPLPKVYLAPFYMAIGLALLLSSMHYYWHLR
jgi:hypothetical protein